MLYLINIFSSNHYQHFQTILLLVTICFGHRLQV